MDLQPTPRKTGYGSAQIKKILNFSALIFSIKTPGKRGNSLDIFNLLKLLCFLVL